MILASATREHAFACVFQAAAFSTYPLETGKPADVFCTDHQAETIRFPTRAKLGDLSHKAPG